MLTRRLDVGGVVGWLERMIRGRQVTYGLLIQRPL